MNPFAIAADAAGNLYIAEAVSAYNPANAVVKETWTASRVVDIAVAMGYERGHGQNRVRRLLTKAGIYKQ